MAEPMDTTMHQCTLTSPSAEMPAAMPVSTAAIDYSSIRGKAVLVSPTEKQYELLRKRLQERIDDSRGETIFDIGIGDGKKWTG